MASGSLGLMAKELGLLLWGYGDAWSISLQVSPHSYVDYLRDATLAECRAFLVGYARGYENATCSANDSFAGERILILKEKWNA